ncbi:MAG: hypothetical protein K0R08_93 [Solimicrobium sp.]|nr:hypothetical protein [Solimicrobium sp.]
MSPISCGISYPSFQSTVIYDKEVVQKDDLSLSSDDSQPAIDDLNADNMGEITHRSAAGFFKLIPEEIALEIWSRLNNLSLNAMRQVSVETHTRVNSLWERYISLNEIPISQLDSFFAFYKALDIPFLKINILSTQSDVFKGMMESLSENFQVKKIQLEVAHYKGRKLDLKDIGHLTNLVTLTSLDVGNNYLGPNGVALVGKLTNLERLDISFNNIGPKGAEPLTILINLNSLNIGHNKLGPTGAEPLSTLTNLKWLEIGCNELGPKGTAPLSTLINLQWLDIGCNKIGLKGTEPLTTLTNLAYLNIEENWGSDTAKGIVCLTELPNLKELFISDTGMGDEGITSLGKMTSLTAMTLAYCELSKIEENKLRSSLPNVNEWFVCEDLDFLHEGF